MKNPKDTKQRRKTELSMIFEMIDASIELSEKSGKHPLTNGCGCIVCANRRKQLLISENPGQEWKFKI